MKPQEKKSQKKAIIIASIIVVVIGLLVTVAVVQVAPFINVITRSAQVNGNYDERVSAMANAKKDFAAGETLVAGPVSITVTKVSRNYQPDARQTAYLDALRTKDLRNREMADSYARWYAWNSPTAEYILIHADVTYDAAGVKDNKYPTFEDSALSVVSSAHFGDNNPVITWINDVAIPERSATMDYDQEKQITQTNSVKVVYLFRVAPETSTSALTFESGIFSKVSNIVGTEGMPRQTFTYTIALE